MGGMPEIAPHIARMPGSGVRHILERALRRPGTIVLAVGEPGEVAGERIRDAAAQAWHAAAIRYTPNGGIPALREAIRAKLARENALGVDLEQIWVTVGATQALHLAMALTLGRGDEVLVPDPGYTTFTMNAHLLQATPVLARNQDKRLEVFVVREDFTEARIKIAFNPFIELFAVPDATTEKQVEWLADITPLFDDFLDTVEGYIEDESFQRRGDGVEAED